MKSAPETEKIIDALAYLIGNDGPMSHPGAPRRYDGIHRIDSSIFDGFEPFGPRETLERLIRGKDASDIPVWPIDSSLAFCGEDEYGRFWEFSRVSTLNPSDARGRLRIVTPKMLKMEGLHVSVKGGALSCVVLCAIVNGKIVDATKIGRSLDGIKADLTAKFHYGASLRQHYHWSVLLGEGDGPRARFLTDPVGVREAFRLRDIPPGKRRRAALRHWVRCHWRQKRDMSADDRAWIEAYLRGATDFAWNGLRCRIEPSVPDQQKARLTA